MAQLLVSIGHHELLPWAQLSISYLWGSWSQAPTSGVSFPGSAQYLLSLRFLSQSVSYVDILLLQFPLIFLVELDFLIHPLFLGSWISLSILSSCTHGGGAHLVRHNTMGSWISLSILSSWGSVTNWRYSFLVYFYILLPTLCSKPRSRRFSV